MTPTAPPDAKPLLTLHSRFPVIRSVLPQWSAAGVVVGWLLLAAAVLFVTQASNAIWAFANPAPHHWDNADYLNLSYNDAWAYRYGGPTEHRVGWRGVVDSVLNNDPNRPPGYRIVSLPTVFLGSRLLPTLRAVSLAVFWATLWVMYRTAAVAVPGPAGRAAGAIAAMLAGLYLEVGWAVRVYGTEYTLYFAVAATLWCFARAWRRDVPGTWVWLGLAMGLGILSKVSFLFLVGPAGLLVAVLSLTGRLPGLRFGRLCGSAVIGAAMAFPYYRHHLFTALHYGQDMMQFGRHSLHKAGPALVTAWVALHVNEGMGRRAAGILAGLVVAAGVVGGVRRWTAGRRGRWDLSPAGWTVVVAVVQGVPLPLFQLLFSTSDNARHMTPAYLPLTVAAAVAAGSAGALAAWWSWPLLVAAAIPAARQACRDFVPLTNTADDLWDWTPLYAICRAHGLRFPYLGRVGNAAQFNEPSLTAPWAARGDWATCTWLWRPDADGPSFDWAAVHARLADRQVVVTAPGFRPPIDRRTLAEPLAADNAHNAEFADRMAAEPGWLPPERFDIGVVDRTTVWVWVRR